MAGQAAKKRLEENRKRLRLLGTFLIVGLACQLISLALRSRKGAVTTSSIVGLVFTTGVGYLCYQTISSIAKPVYHEGELIDGGGDLNRGGINGYAHDILYITAFVQVTTLLSSWFWYFYLTIPAYALYQLTQKVIIPWLKSRGQGDGDQHMDAATRKKLQRAEERAQRRRNKWS